MMYWYHSVQQLGRDPHLCPLSYNCQRISKDFQRFKYDSGTIAIIILHLSKVTVNTQLSIQHFGTDLEKIVTLTLWKCSQILIRWMWKDMRLINLYSP